jgi:arsenate reductase-like glutaredoxin family protein
LIEKVVPRSKRCRKIKHKVEHLQEHGSTYKKYIKKDVPMLENLVSFYQKSNGRQKERYLAASFLKKSTLKKTKMPLFHYMNQFGF